MTFVLGLPTLRDSPDLDLIDSSLKRTSVPLEDLNCSATGARIFTFDAGFPATREHLTQDQSVCPLWVMSRHRVTSASPVSVIPLKADNLCHAR